VLDPGRGRTKKGYFWAIARDDRSWGGTDPPAVAYSYAPGRGAIHALKLLEHYRGVVQCDGYAAYKNIADNTACGEVITLAFCWAHLRRRFFDIAKDGAAPIASVPRRPFGLDRTLSSHRRGHSTPASPVGHAGRRGCRALPEDRPVPLRRLHSGRRDRDVARCARRDGLPVCDHPSAICVASACALPRFSECLF
jgi:Transposase IS66 family